MDKESASALINSFEGAVQRAFENHQPKPITIKLGKKNITTPCKYYHNKFETVLRPMAIGLNVFMVGPAGSGKTLLAEQAAQVLDMKFYSISVCAQTTVSALYGYMNAEGGYVKTLFREAYENGGMFLLDEIDNGNPNVLSVLNSALSNEYCAFPDKMVKKHKGFLLCASGNTYGTGANRQYVGRLQIDAATLDRFVFIEIPYDIKLETIICGCYAWSKLVQELRKGIYKHEIRHIISPRASIFGVKLLLAGFSIKEALEYSVFKGLKKDDRVKITPKDGAFELFEADVLKEIKKLGE